MSFQLTVKMFDYPFNYKGKLFIISQNFPYISIISVYRAMAAEAEAAREARAKVIAAEGEQKASRYDRLIFLFKFFLLIFFLFRALKDAADVIMQSPTALQLRYLQTLTTIASEKNSTIVFPIPVMEMMTTKFHITSYLETRL